jgi:hypothetical protein
MPNASSTRLSCSVPQPATHSSPHAATVYGKDANSWAADNINSTNSQNQQYAVQLQDKEGYRTCEW